jgi:hypothetical protein
MTTRVLFGAPVTQSTEAIESLLKYLGKPIDPLPDVVKLLDMVLVLSNRKNAYYVTTVKSCSCPSAAYRPGQKCKHQRRYFPGTDAPGRVTAETSDSIRPSGKWPGGFNGPVDIDTINTKIALDQKGA